MKGVNTPPRRSPNIPKQVTRDSVSKSRRPPKQVSKGTDSKSRMLKYIGGTAVLLGILAIAGYRGYHSEQPVSETGEPATVAPVDQRPSRPDPASVAPGLGERSGNSDATPARG